MQKSDNWDNVVLLSKRQRKPMLNLLGLKLRHLSQLSLMSGQRFPFYPLSRKIQDNVFSKNQKPIRQSDNGTTLACRPLWECACKKRHLVFTLKFRMLKSNSLFLIMLKLRSNKNLIWKLVLFYSFCEKDQGHYLAGIFRTSYDSGLAW